MSDLRALRSALWSERCRHGIRLGRVRVPDGFAFLPLDASDVEIAARIPTFVEVKPESGILAE